MTTGLKNRLQKSRIGKYIDFSSKRAKPTYRRICFTMATMMLCYGIGAYVGCVDYMSVPVVGTERWMRENPNHTVGTIKIEDPKRVWEWDMGNGFMSNLESAVMLLSMFFGFMRTIDLIVLFYREDPEKFMEMLNKQD